MSDRYFLDTNVFVYCFDREDRLKQQKANAMVQQALRDGLGVISSQVVQEFINVATKKFQQRMNPTECRAYLDGVLAPLCQVFSSISLYQLALELEDETGFLFYDCLILAAAVQARCARIYSEDLQAGRTIRGVQIINPFAKIATK